MKNKRKLVENGRLFGKIGVVDILAVALIVVLLAMVYVRFTTEDSVNVAVGRDRITFELKVASVRSFTSDMLHKGDEVYVGVDEEERIGTVTDVRVEQATQLTATLDGQVIEMPVEDRYNVFITVEQMGRYDHNAYFLTDDFELRLYDTISFMTRYVQSNGTVMSLTAAEGSK